MKNKNFTQLTNLFRKKIATGVAVILFLTFIIRIFYVILVFSHSPFITRLYNFIRPDVLQRRYGYEVGKVLHADETVYDNIGQNLAKGKGFTLDFGSKTTVVAPGYPLFVGLIYKIFGHHYLAVIVAQVILDCFTCFLVYLIGLRIFRKRRIALLASGIFAVYLPSAMWTSNILTETLFTFLLALFFLSLIILFETATQQYRNTAARQYRTTAALFTGLLLGLVCLTRPMPLLFPLFLLFFMLIFPQGMRRLFILKILSILILGMIIVLTPWTVRNYKLYHRFIPVSTGGGKVFAYGSELLKGKTPEEELIKKRGYYPATAESQKSLYIKAIRNLKDITPKILLIKFSRLWLNIGFVRPPSKKSIMVGVANGILIIFTILGYVLVRGNWKRKSFPILLFLIYLTLVHLLATCKVRFVIPVMPYLMLFASNGMFGLFKSRINTSKLV